MKSERTGHGGHLDDDAIQGLLDARRARAGAGPESARRHLADCAGCRARLDAWREVFDELGRLRRFAPPGRFAERVLSAVELRGTARARSWTRPVRWARRAFARTHLAGRTLQDLADGALSRRRAALARAHLATCARCASELADWRRLVTALEALPALAPAAGFAEGAMARWRGSVSETARGNPAARARRFRPRSPRGWVLAGTLASVPAAGFAGAAAFVSTVPQLTGGGLATYLLWQVRDALSALGGSLLATGMQSAATFRAYTLAEPLIASPATAVAGAAGFTALTFVSLWVLHRNLGLPRLAFRHAHG